MKQPLIKSWIDEFLADHEASHREAGWPWRSGPAGRENWNRFFDAFKGNGVSEGEARAASDRIAADVPFDEHPDRVVQLVVEARRAASELPTVPTSDDRDSAVAASRDCPRCRGDGLCDVFDPDYDGRRIVDRKFIIKGEFVRRAYPMIVAAHCTCALGRWTRRKTEPALLARIPDLADVLAGRSRYLAEDPRGD